MRSAPKSAGVDPQDDPLGRHPLARALAGERQLVGVGLEHLRVLDDDAHFAAALVVDPAADQDHAVDLDRLGSLTGGVADEQLNLALEVVELREHHVAAVAGPHLLRLADDAADADPGAVRLGRDVGERAVDPLAQRLANLGQRMVGEERAERLLLEREQLPLARTPRRAPAGAGW